MGRVGFIGMGKMGSRMAARLLGAGHDVVVYNRSRDKSLPLGEKGARIAESPAQAAAGADIVFTCVADGPALKAVCLGPEGLFAAKPAPKLYVDTCTIAPGESAEIGEAAKAAGVPYLRIPVIGTMPHVEAGALILLISGEQADYEAAKPYLDVLGSVHHYLGVGERSRFVKLAVTMQAFAQVFAAAEGMVLAEKSGTDLKQMAQITSDSAAGSGIVKIKAANMAARNFDPFFEIRMTLKDLNLALAAAEGAGVEMPMIKKVRDLYAAAAEAGFGEKDYCGSLLYLEKLAGIESR